VRLAASVYKSNPPGRKNGLCGKVIFPSWHAPSFSASDKSPMRSPTATRFAAVDDQNS
jgi:hypothetical protein